MAAVLDPQAEHAVPGDQVGRARGLGVQGLVRRRKGQGGGSAPVRKDQAPVYAAGGFVEAQVRERLRRGRKGRAGQAAGATGEEAAVARRLVRRRTGRTTSRRVAPRRRGSSRSAAR